MRNVLWNEGDFKLFNNGVYECNLTSESDDLMLSPKMRRDDKTSVNSKYIVLRTVRNVIENIQPIDVWKALISLS